MDSRKPEVVSFSQSNTNNELPALFSSSSALAMVSLRIAELCATIENAFGAPVERKNHNFTMKLLSSPCGMLNAMSNLTKRLYSPLYLVTDYNGYRERISSLSRRISGLVNNLRHSFAPVRDGRNDQCTYMHLNQLANQLQQLTENVANLQEANEEFKLKYHQENLLAEVGDMKGYLELLYQQLKHEELQKLRVEEENIVLRQSVEKYTAIDCPWNISTRRESHGHCEKYSTTNLFGLEASEWKGKNPPAVIETSLNEFQLKISYLYQETSVAWARPPKEGDAIVFIFNEPVLLKSYKIGTGHFEYPTNKLSDATVEILPTSSAKMERKQNFCVTSDNFLVVGHFDQSGLAEGIVDWQSIGTIERLRVTIHSTHERWVIMTELLLDTLPLDGEGTHSEDYFECW